MIKKIDVRFNSMIVRLKAQCDKIFYEKSSFQFYDSPIKRIPVFGGLCSFKKFQFYDSPIKRIYSPPYRIYLPYRVSIL